MSDDCQVSVRFHQPPEALRSYFTSFYATDVAVAGGRRVVDYLHPEWAGLRFVTGDLPEAVIAGSPAQALADVLVDGHDHPAFAGFAGLADTVFGTAPDEDEELARIAAFFLASPDRKLSDEERIVACHTALVDPDVATVAEMAEHTGIAPYTIERLCRRHFGFPPQLLLRRQRFMRSLAQFMLDPSLKWIGALDSHYHDQAQFA